MYDFLVTAGSVVASIWATLLAYLVIDGIWRNRSNFSDLENSQQVPWIFSIIALGWLLTLFMIWT